MATYYLLITVLFSWGELSSFVLETKNGQDFCNITMSSAVEELQKNGHTVQEAQCIEDKSDIL